MKKLILIIPAVVLFISGCSSSDNLDNSVYIYDEEYTDLPVYTEWGYNTFGAYLDRDVFISGSSIPAKVFSTGNTTTFALYGTLTGDYNQMILKFILEGYKPAEYKDLVSLNDSTINLAGSLCKVCLTLNGEEDTLHILNGELYFKRVQHLYVDKQSAETIMSGYFQLQMLIDGTPSTISHGRFDVGISYDNFYAY
jgi:hypothetical protein